VTRRDHQPGTGPVRGLVYGGAVCALAWVAVVVLVLLWLAGRS